MAIRLITLVCIKGIISTLQFVITIVPMKKGAHYESGNNWHIIINTIRLRNIQQDAGCQR
jgi:hypothetical protein